jgi:hypothetical protein
MYVKITADSCVTVHTDFLSDIFLMIKIQQNTAYGKQPTAKQKKKAVINHKKIITL